MCNAFCRKVRGRLKRANAGRSRRFHKTHRARPKQLLKIIRPRYPFLRHSNIASNTVPFSSIDMSTCEVGNGYNGHMGARISAIFVILVGSTVGAIFPIFARRRIKNKYMEYAFFFAKYFGSGVIIATAFIHLLAPATNALTDPCLTGPITDYDWAEGICLMMVFLLFFVELMTMKFAGFAHDHSHEEERHGSRVDVAAEERRRSSAIEPVPNYTDSQELDETLKQTEHTHDDAASTHQRGDDHLGHGRAHANREELELDDSYGSQMVAMFILEFGVIFHSIFIGLTLAVAGDEFVSLYVVLVFHQTFEGLGLGTRLASTPWPKSKQSTPYWMAIAFGVSTPIAIAIGLGVRKIYPPGSQTTLIVNGVFDSLSAGVLIYTGLVELMAHEFMFSPRMRKEPLKVVVAAYLQMCLGAGLMALLGKWA